MKSKNTHNNEKYHPGNKRERDSSFSAEDANPSVTHGGNSIDGENESNKDKKSKFNPFKDMTTQQLRQDNSGFTACPLYNEAD